MSVCTPGKTLFIVVPSKACKVCKTTHDTISFRRLNVYMGTVLLGWRVVYGTGNESAHQVEVGVQCYLKVGPLKLHPSCSHPQWDKLCGYHLGCTPTYIYGRREGIGGDDKAVLF